MCFFVFPGQCHQSFILQNRKIDLGDLQTQPFRRFFDVNGRLAGVLIRTVYQVLGLEAMADDHYRHDARALTNTSVCRLELDEVDSLGDKQAAFTQALMQLMSHQLHQEYRLFQLLGTHSTEQRLATFLLNYASRLHENGMPYLEFRLPMTRRDIADYLGIALETVSRVFKQFQDKGLLEVRGKMTRICNVDGLNALAIRWHDDYLNSSPQPAC